MKCKIELCNHTAKKDGFCGWCFKKQIKNLPKVDEVKINPRDPILEISSKGSAKLSKSEIKDKIVSWEKSKKILIKEFKTRPTALKVLQTLYPESKKSIYCKAQEFFTAEASCYNRIFIQNKDPECVKCHFWDSKFEYIQEFLNNEVKQNHGNEEKQVSTKLAE